MTNEKAVRSSAPSPKQQQWGLLVSITMIVMMIVVGAFYAWNKRMAQQQEFGESLNANVQQN